MRRLWVSHPSVVLAGLLVASPQPLEAVEFLLAAQVIQATVAGVVRDEETGRPLAGAVVALTDLNRHTGTDVMGRYVLRLVPAGPQHITVRSIGHAPRTLHALVPRDGQLESTFRSAPSRCGSRPSKCALRWSSAGSRARTAPPSPTAAAPSPRYGTTPCCRSRTSSRHSAAGRSSCSRNRRAESISGAARRTRPRTSSTGSRFSVPTTLPGCSAPGTPTRSPGSTCRPRHHPRRTRTAYPGPSRRPRGRREHACTRRGVPAPRRCASPWMARWSPVRASW